MCSTTGRSQGMYITFASEKKVNKAEPSLALKPRGEVTRNPKQGYQWRPKKTCVSRKLKKKEGNNRCPSAVLLTFFPQSSLLLYVIIREVKVQV